MSPDILLVAAGAFAGTNVDDFVALATIFIGDRAAGNRNTARIWAGQLIGIGVLVAASVGAAKALASVPAASIGWLALIPIAIGIRALVPRRRVSESVRTASGTTMAVAALTVANGGDNLAVYIPLFHSLGAPDTVAALACFAAMTVLWCVAARFAARAPGIAPLATRLGPLVTPFAYIAIGTIALARSMA